MSNLIKVDDSGLLKSLGGIVDRLDSLKQDHSQSSDALNALRVDIESLIDEVGDLAAKVDQLPQTILKLVKTHLQQPSIQSDDSLKIKPVQDNDTASLTAPAPTAEHGSDKDQAIDDAIFQDPLPSSVIAGKVNPQGSSKRPRRSSSISQRFSDNESQVDEAPSDKKVTLSLPTEHKKLGYYATEWRKQQRPKETAQQPNTKLSAASRAADETLRVEDHMGVSSPELENPLHKFKPRKHRKNWEQKWLAAHVKEAGVNPEIAGFTRAQVHAAMQPTVEDEGEAAGSSRPLLEVPMHRASMHRTRPARERKKPEPGAGFIPTPDFHKASVRRDYEFNYG